MPSPEGTVTATDSARGPRSASRRPSARPIVRVARRSMAAHNLRMAMTVLAVVLGTAFVSGAFMFSATLNKAFGEILDAGSENVDVMFSGGRENAAGVPYGVVDELRARDDVGLANITGTNPNIVVGGPDGKAIPSGGAGAYAFPYYPEGEVVDASFEILEGRAPGDAGEVMMNTSAMEAGGVSVGDEITVVTASERMHPTVVGVFEPPTAVGGWIGVIFERAEFMGAFTDGEHVGSVDMRTAAGVTPDELADALRADYPGYEITTGADFAEQSREDIADALSFLTYFLLAFGLIALLVGTFIISNTFAMIVAQRTREFGLLRALGASRSQLTTAVLAEAAIIGLVGSLLGILVGAGLVKLLQAGMEAMSFGFPDAGVGVDARSILIPVAVGVIVTMVSSWTPANRAGRVAPIEAMRSGDLSSSAPLTKRTVTGAVFLLAGAATALAGALVEDWSTNTRATLVGLGAVLVIVGTWLFAAGLMVPVGGILAKVFGGPFGAVGKLAGTNTRRNPRRSAATAFALTLALALISSVGFLAATMRGSLAETVASDLRADFVLTGPQIATMPIPRDALDDAAGVDGVRAVGSSARVPVVVAPAGDRAGVTPEDVYALNESSGGTQPAGLSFDGDLARFVAGGRGEDDEYLDATVAGSLDLAAPDSGVIVSDAMADEQGLELGDDMTVVGPFREMNVPVTGIFRSTQVAAPVFVPDRLVPDLTGSDPMYFITYVAVDGDVTANPVTAARELDRMRAGLEDAVSEYLIVSVADRDEFGQQSVAQIEQLQNIIYALLGLAIVIAVLGIINTLALSIIERRREIGMLRAVGMHRRQIRRMIRLESLQIAVYGALSGTVIGLGLGWCFVKVMSGDGLLEVVVPWGSIGVMLVASAIVGVLAAAWPAHRASKTPPLAAIAGD